MQGLGLLYVCPSVALPVYWLVKHDKLFTPNLVWLGDFIAFWNTLHSFCNVFLPLPCIRYHVYNLRYFFELCSTIHKP